MTTTQNICLHKARYLTGKPLLSQSDVSGMNQENGVICAMAPLAAMHPAQRTKSVIRRSLVYQA